MILRILATTVHASPAFLYCAASCGYMRHEPQPLFFALEPGGRPAFEFVLRRKLRP